MNGDLLVGVVQVHGEACREDGFGRRGHAAVLADGISGETGLRPFGDNQDFAVDHVRDEGVGEGDGVAVLAVGRIRVGVTEGVDGGGFVAMLGQVDGPEMFLLRGFEEEG